MIPGLTQTTVSSGVKPIAANSPSVVALLVNTKRGIPNKKKFLSTFEQARNYLGDYMADSYSMLTLKTMMEYHGASKVYVSRVVGSTAVKATGSIGASPSDMVFEIQSPGTDANGASLVITKHSFVDQFKVELYAPLDEGSVLLYSSDGLSSDPASSKYIASYINTECDWLSVTDNMASKVTFDALFSGTNTVTVAFAGGVDATPKVSDYSGDVTNKTGIHVFDAEGSIRTLIIPDSPIIENATILDQKGLQVIMTAWCEGKEHVNYIDVVPKSTLPGGVKAIVIDNWALNSINTAVYWNWVKVQDPLTGLTKLIPPHGSAFGVWNDTDAGQEGVHKAPANEQCKGVVGLEYEDVTDSERGLLNDVGVNPIIKLNGYRVYGARMRTNDTEWAFIHVRRTYQMLLTSVLDSSTWIPFTVKDNITMGKVRRNIENFFRSQDRRLNPQGSLYNKVNPTEVPYYVVCDTTNNTGNIGELVIDWAVSIVDTNEVVKYRTSLWDGGQSTVRI